MISAYTICKYQTCFVDKIVNWTDKLNHGENKEADDDMVLAMHEILETIIDYDFYPKKEVKTRSVIVPCCDILNFESKSVILYKSTCIDLDPEVVNCMNPEDLCPMIEQLAILCADCDCNC